MSRTYPRVRAFRWPDLTALGVTSWRACSMHQGRAYPSLSVRVLLTAREATDYRAHAYRTGGLATLNGFRRAVFDRYLTSRGVPAHRWTFHPVGQDWSPDPFAWHPWPFASVVVHTEESEPSPPGFQDTCGWAYPCWAWAVKQTLGDAHSLKLDLARILRRRGPVFLDGIAAVFDLGGTDALLEYLNSLPCIQKLATGAGT